MAVTLFFAAGLVMAVLMRMRAGRRRAGRRRPMAGIMLVAVVVWVAVALFFTTRLVVAVLMLMGGAIRRRLRPPTGEEGERGDDRGKASGQHVFGV
ncbi:MAG TPA: hypothetical protein VFS43_12960 [Polyangiaceae bacterium]|nr:hypothetical protein [Polyangiaceae bacterium]